MLNLSLSLCPNHFNLSADYSNLSEEMMVELVQRWYEAADKNLNTSGRIKLYKDTKQTVNALKALYANQSVESKDRIAKLCNAMLQEFDKHRVGESEHLAIWIGHSTTYKPGPNMELKGAYKSLHHLFSFVAEAKECPDIFNPISNDSDDYYGILHQIGQLAPLSYIDSAAMQYIELNKRDLSFANDGQALIFSQLSLKDLLTIRESSSYSRMTVNSELVHRINSGKLTLFDLGIMQDFRINQNRFIGKRITDFFGDICSEIVNLDFEYCDLTDVSFLEHFPNLQSLNLGYCTKITDFCILQKLPKLQSLFLRKCEQIIDLSFLQYCPNIQELNLQSCDKINFNSLSQNYSNLKTLDLGGCDQITDFSFLKYFPNLQNLKLGYKNICVDFGFLNYCQNLQNVKISCCKLVNLNLKQVCPNLQNLHLANVETTDLEVLQYFPNLLKISLSEHRKNYITDLTPLKNCTKLQSLRLKGLKIIDLNVLRFFPKLKIFNFGECNEITDISVLQECRNLEEFSLSCNPKWKNVDFSFLQNFFHLQKLTLRDFKYSQTKILDFLQNCSKTIRNLTFIRCGIKNAEINILQQYTALQSLGFFQALDFGNSNTDLTPLLFLPKFKEVFFGPFQITKAQKQVLREKGITIHES